MPAPSPPTVFPRNQQFLTAGLPWKMNIPPPSAPWPLPVIVKPSRTVPGPSPLADLTTLSSIPRMSMTVAAGPPEPRSVICLPARSIVS